MIGWLWQLIENRVEAAITRRIVLFHNALIERKQIKPPPIGYGIQND